MINTAAVNMEVQMSFQYPVFISIGYIYRRGISRSYGGLFLIFCETSIHFVKLLEGNIQMKLLDTSLGDDFFGYDIKKKGNKSKNQSGPTIN